MIIDCIGCLHGARPKLEGGDLLIVTGDLTARNMPIEYIDFYEWCKDQPYKKIIIIGGNHDSFIQNLKSKFFPPTTYYSHCEYLCDSGTEFEYEKQIHHPASNQHVSIDVLMHEKRKVKIWGSPWTAQFKGINPECTAFTVKHFDHTDEVLDEYWNKIPKDTDILITHGPPYGILDKTSRGKHVGSHTLLITSMLIEPRLHVFSHIHEEGGQHYIHKRPGYGDENNTHFVNCSIMNENYKPVNKPMRVYL